MLHHRLFGYTITVQTEINRTLLHTGFIFSEYQIINVWSSHVDVKMLVYMLIIGGGRHDRMVVGFPNYLCNQYLSPLILWDRTPLRRGVLDTTSCHKVCQWLATGRWFSPGTPVSSTNKTDRHDITEILLKVAFNTIN